MRSISKKHSTNSGISQRKHAVIHRLRGVGAVVEQQPHDLREFEDHTVGIALNLENDAAPF